MHAPCGDVLLQGGVATSDSFVLVSRCQQESCIRTGETQPSMCCS